MHELRLVNRAVQQDYKKVVHALHLQSDHGRKTMTAEDLQHSIQKSGESVSDFI